MKKTKIIFKAKRKIENTLKDESGMGVIEVILIVLVLAGLALLFQDKIELLAESIFKIIDGQIKKF